MKAFERAVPGARGPWRLCPLASTLPQHNLNLPAFHRPREVLFLFLWILNSKTYFPFVVGTSLLFLPTAAGFSITQVSGRGTGSRIMRGSSI